MSCSLVRSLRTLATDGSVVTWPLHVIADSRCLLPSLIFVATRFYQAQRKTKRISLSLAWFTLAPDNLPTCYSIRRRKMTCLLSTVVCRDVNYIVCSRLLVITELVNYIVLLTTFSDNRTGKLHCIVEGPFVITELVNYILLLKIFSDNITGKLHCIVEDL